MKLCQHAVGAVGTGFCAHAVPFSIASAEPVVVRNKLAKSQLKPRPCEFFEEDSKDCGLRDLQLYGNLMSRRQEAQPK